MGDVESVQKIHHAYSIIRERLSSVIVGQSSVIEELLISLFAGGHCLLEGVPGLGKTLIIRTLASLLDLDFQRIQCTPDLMPSDITGCEMVQEVLLEGRTQRTAQFEPGPVFTNFLLADEINRTAPRTQSALLEAMQERQVTVGRKRHALPQPFFVLATQNPLEHEGTYPLPEAQLDRFMFNTLVDYPSKDEEVQIIMSTTSEKTISLSPVLTHNDLEEVLTLVRRVPAAENVVRYATELVRASRPDKSQQTELGTWIYRYVEWGAGPRAGQSLILGAKARAVLHGQYNAQVQDVQAVAPGVLRHRLAPNFAARAEGITGDIIIQKILKTIHT